ncbi:hypothetical protein V8C35DRAFT_9064 [Trichoderma chlorosporum]
MQVLWALSRLVASAPPNMDHARPASMSSRTQDAITTQYCTALLVSNSIHGYEYSTVVTCMDLALAIAAHVLRTSMYSTRMCMYSVQTRRVFQTRPSRRDGDDLSQLEACAWLFWTRVTGSPRHGRRRQIMAANGTRPLRLTWHCTTVVYVRGVEVRLVMQHLTLTAISDKAEGRHGGPSVGLPHVRAAISGSTVAMSHHQRHIRRCRKHAADASSSRFPLCLLAKTSRKAGQRSGSIQRLPRCKHHGWEKGASGPTRRRPWTLSAAVRQTPMLLESSNPGILGSPWLLQQNPRSCLWRRVCRYDRGPRRRRRSTMSTHTHRMRQLGQGLGDKPPLTRCLQLPGHLYG